MSTTTTTPQRPAWRRLVTLLGIVGMLVAIMAVFAPAQPAAADCKPQGVPTYAGSGLSGEIDGPVAEPTGGNYYGEYGWSGLRWNTCDIRDTFALADDWNAQIDTWGGNALMGVAVLEASAMTSLHKWTADPTTALKPIDDKVVQLSEVTSTLLFDQWAFPVIVLAAIGILVAGIRRQVRPAIITVGAVAAALGFMSIVASFPLTVAQSTDGVASAVVSAADARALEVAGIPESATGNGDEHEVTASAAEGTGAILNDAMLQPMWRLGQTGSVDWADTTDAMFKASTASFDEVEAGYEPDDKRDEYNEAVDAVKNDDATANQYQTVKGQSYNRTGAGFMAAVMMTAVAAIRIPAEALMFLGLLVVRLIPILGPLFALMAIPAVTRGAATAGLKIVAASLYNVVVFGVIAAVHTAFVAILYVGSTNLFFSTVISIIVTFLLWKVSKPFRSVTKLATGQQVAQELADAPSAPAKAGKAAVGLLTGTASSFAGNTFANRGEARKRADRKEIAEPERAHPGPDTRTETEATETDTALHPDWAKAPNVNPAWAEAPVFDPEDKFNGLSSRSTDWDEPIYTPPGEANRGSGSPALVADDSLSEPEFVGGNMVTSIYVPGEPEGFTGSYAITPDDSAYHAVEAPSGAASAAPSGTTSDAPSKAESGNVIVPEVTNS